MLFNCIFNYLEVSVVIKSLGLSLDVTLALDIFLLRLWLRQLIYDSLCMFFPRSLEKNGQHCSIYNLSFIYVLVSTDRGTETISMFISGYLSTRMICVNLSRDSSNKISLKLLLYLPISLNWMPRPTYKTPLCTTFRTISNNCVYSYVLDCELISACQRARSVRLVMQTFIRADSEQRTS